MKVVILATTDASAGATIIGLTFDSRLLRFTPAPAAQLNLAVGDVWQLDGAFPTNQPPHVETIDVRGGRQQPPLADLAAFIAQRVAVADGSASGLFDSTLQSAPDGTLYVTPRTGLPTGSIQFWRPDQPLVRVENDNQLARYRYGDHVTIPCASTADAPATIEAGTLLCLSLGAWQSSGGERRCPVQLAGWFAADSAESIPLADDIPPDWIEDDDIDYASYAYETLPMPTLLQRAEPFIVGSSPEAVLRDIFGYSEFKPLQRRIIDNVLAGHDTLAIMPTGGGKSLCYQLPALLMNGLTVVISPLIALMQDQVSQLQEWGVPALFLNSTMDQTEQMLAAQAVRQGEVKLLYLAPESLLRPETMALLDGSGIACLAIDEAHCISQWGHDFRPEYRRLADVRRRYASAVCIALTATATERVRADIMQSLAFSAHNSFVSSFDRPNLYIDVQPRVDMVRQSADFLRAHPNQSGIIYCNTIKQVEFLATALRDRGFSVARYHGQLDATTRARNQTAFIRDQVPVIVATIAFGMGIDKPDVRFILHAELPKSAEHYYQQIGRAGRDDLPADCRLLYSSADVRTHQYFINQGAASEADGREQRLRQFVAWAESNACRRQQLLGYFGEQFVKENCDNCDNCTRSPDQLVDLTVPALKFLSCVYRTGQSFGAAHVIDVLRGSRSKKVLQRNHDKLSTYDIGRDLPKQAWQQLASQLVQQDLLGRDVRHGGLYLTADGIAALKEQRPFHGTPLVTMRAQSGSAELEGARSSPLFERLRAKRAELASERGVPPYIIFSDRALLDMVRFLPTDDAAFLNMHGVGRRKSEQYAAVFLPIIRAYRRQNGVTPANTAPAPPGRG